MAQRAEAVKAGKCERGRKDIAAEVLASEKATELNGDERDVDLSNASEAQLLEELNRRRRERVRKSGGNKEAKATNDRELDADLTEKQMFCTADGCRREP